MNTSELCEQMERVDLLLMKLDFAIELLLSSSSLSREELMIACERQGYSSCC
jgi:hypothetical protein